MKGRGHLEDPRKDEEITPKWFFRMHGQRVRIRFSCLRTGTHRELLDNGTSGSIK
jgi:hypothetical protein